MGIKNNFNYIYNISFHNCYLNTFYALLDVGHIQWVLHCICNALFVTDKSSFYDNNHWNNMLYTMSYIKPFYQYN